jgi:small subunit ribosomal protein S4
MEDVGKRTLEKYNFNSMRYTGPKNRLARREGQDLFLKSTPVDASRPLGVMKKKFAKLSEYGKQLREKQKAKRIYNLTERSFFNYYKKASKKRGETGFFLLSSLELRVDNVIYKAGFALTRAQARQMVNHGVYCVNGKKVDIPSFQVSVGDVIEVRERFHDHPVLLEMSDKKSFVSKWLLSDIKKKRIEVKRLPEGDELELSIDVQSIIEFYSR